MMKSHSKIELFKEDMKFSAAHFTVFSAKERENLHGHNFNLHATFVTHKDPMGLSFDYRFYKQMLRELCRQLDEVMIIPELCQYIKIVETAAHFHIEFNHETMQFPKRDVVILPISNVTVEALSDWFITRLISDQRHLIENKILSIHVKVYTSPGQSGESFWEK